MFQTIVQSANKSMDEESCQTVINELNNLLSLRDHRPNDPMLDSDYTCLTHICITLLSECLGLPKRTIGPSNYIPDLLTLWNASNALLNETYVQLWNESDSAM